MIDQSFFSALVLLTLALVPVCAVCDQFPLPIASYGLNQHSGTGIAVNDDRKNGRRRRRLYDNRLPEGGPQSEVDYMMGSFFTYIYVGSPPQRVSVIIDTGSHHTAFPCVGCKCGKHLDPPFDPKKSSSSEVSNCRGKKCYLHQSYSEGSSWHAYEVKDQVWVGGEMAISTDPGKAKQRAIDSSHANQSVKFQFGCQDKETGLFRTQKIDGIMGLSAHPLTLPFVLKKNKMTETKAFSMCFRVGGGVLSLGGVDTRLHTTGAKPSIDGTIKFANLLKAEGWFTVRMKDILMRNPVTGETKSIGLTASKYASGKGTIVDSGTTDTYLPSAAAGKFNSLFSKMAGRQYHNKMMSLSHSDISALPTIIYRLERAGGRGTIDVECPPTAYTEEVKSKGGLKHTFRIYTSEAQGAVLGSNFMVGHDVIFDIENRRIGFADSSCDSDPSPTTPKSAMIEQDQSLTQNPIVPVPVPGTGTGVSRITFAWSDPATFQSFSESLWSPSIHSEAASLSLTPSANSNAAKCGERRAQIASPCSAACSLGPESKDNNKDQKEETEGYIQSGVQTWQYLACSSPASGDNSATQTPSVVTSEQICDIKCGPNRIGLIQGPSLACAHETWSDCNANCTQSRMRAMLVEEDTDGGFLTKINPFSPTKINTQRCTHIQEQRECMVNRCPVRTEDHAVTFEISLRSPTLSIASWTSAHKMELLQGLSGALRLPESQFHLFSGPSIGTKGALNFEVKLRITKAHFGKDTNSVATRVVDIAQDTIFPLLVAASLNGDLTEEANAKKFHWMSESVITVHSAVPTKLEPKKRPDAIDSGVFKKPPKSSGGIHNQNEKAPLSSKMLRSGFTNPWEWNSSTWLKVLVVAVIQIVFFGLFFIFRRVGQIISEPEQGFDAYRGAKESKESKDALLKKKKVSSSAGKRRGQQTHIV